LLKSSHPENKESLLSYSQQKREKVRKQIWYQDTSPLYFRIDSDESELFFFRQNNEVEVVEQLGKVVCIMQEELYFDGAKPMQRVRYLEADQACYNYNSHLFVAEDVRLWKYQLEGHEPPTQFKKTHPLMHATAHSIEFSLRGKKLDFTAHQMRAAVNNRERVL
ncbi:MAG TPA: hypothetical protein VIH61_07885, partial [Waddliaceae bacterium]